ncbi:peptide chain release factor N(5)-glutamine methyltransferase [bacterium]|nr:peptide chain release factor N(5)-glutamine methyltransferase [bacterium]
MTVSEREELWLREFAEKSGEDLAALLKKRESGYPLAYLIGSQPFHEIELKITPDVLVPRPETEEMVERILKEAKPTGKGLDLGCGSGAIALALAHALPGWTFAASDISQKALDLAKENAKKLGLDTRGTFYLGSWFEAIPKGETFDLIVTNPPYVGDMEEIDLGASYEPKLALFAGPDGLDCYRLILSKAKDYLKEGGLFMGECGPYHAKALLELAKEAGLISAEILKDYSGRDRFIRAVKG